MIGAIKSNLTIMNEDQTGGDEEEEEENGGPGGYL
jgi:hypothetical protein